MPFFSAVMPAYNAEVSISRAIESVLAQSFDDWELVVVDDGSKDATADVVRGFADRDPRVKLVSQENAGCGAARNTAVLASRGEYLLRFDADDELLPEYMERMAGFIAQRPGYDIYSCNGYHLYPDGTRRLARPGERYEREQSFTLEDMFAATHIFTIAVFSRDLFDRAGGIRPDVYCEDVDFWLRSFALAGATHRYTPEALALYTVSDTQMTADFSRVCESRIGIYQDLIDTGRLSEEDAALARSAIERTRADERIYRWRSAVQLGVSRVFGDRAGEAVSRAMHSSARTLRPVASRIASVLPGRKAGT